MTMRDRSFSQPPPIRESDRHRPCQDVGCGKWRSGVIFRATRGRELHHLESPKAQPPEPLRQKDRVRSKTLESGTGARRLRTHRRGTPP